MTDVNKDDVINKSDEERLKRRRILKAGAVIAPLAVTLHGGNAMAQVVSATCVEKMEGQLIIPQFEETSPGQFTEVGKQEFSEFPMQATTGRPNPSNPAVPETHWDYISLQDSPGHSCYNSITIASGGN
ncbi:hypothetical protein [Paremcibacter congregatus]|uniref:hypothetical protein n=1 Tax=Paremcibacter congregatus TaxID=2043170 RepID=UPI0030EC00C3|tara:strand:- start:1234 stop:1620 length:387 start_codon:yes stop_codon:yes gene_type:complete